MKETYLLEIGDRIFELNDLIMSDAEPCGSGTNGNVGCCYLTHAACALTGEVLPLEELVRAGFQTRDKKYMTSVAISRALYESMRVEAEETRRAHEAQLAEQAKQAARLERRKQRSAIRFDRHLQKQAGELQERQRQQEEAVDRATFTAIAGMLSALCAEQ